MDRIIKIWPRLTPVVITLLLLFAIYLYTKDDYYLFQVTTYNSVTESYDSRNPNEKQKEILIRYLEANNNEYEIRNGDIYVDATMGDSPDVMYKYTKDFGLAYFND